MPSRRLAVIVGSTGVLLLAGTVRLAVSSISRGERVEAHFPMSAPVRSATKNDPPNPLPLNALEPRTSWMGLYIQKKKVGWGRFALKRLTASGGSERYRMEQFTYMNVATMGVSQESRINFTLDFTSDLQPLSYTFSLEAPGFWTKSKGEVHEGVLKTRISAPGGDREYEFSIDSGVDLFGLSELREAIDGYEVGKKVSGEIFEPNVFGVVPYSFKVLAEESVRVGDAVETAYRIHSVIRDVVTESLVLPNGDILRSEGPMGIVMVREPEAVAKKMDAGTDLTDLVFKFSIPAETSIPDFEDVRRVRMSVTMEGGILADSGASQRVFLRGDTRAEVEMDVIHPYRVSLTEEEREKWTAPTPFLQADDPRVREKAREITKGAGSDWEKVTRVVHWVYQNVEKVPAFTLPSTVDVLESMRGDCNEHAALVGGLVRSLGIPCRTAAGVVFLQGAFFYHAWNEVYLGGTWKPVDATFDQIPANALRLRMITGSLDRQVGIAAAVGRTKIEVESISREP
ncbi:MAG: transglutaminase domain-containing protein [Candidatus Hydrogenedentota bacterium]|nr:MAG: transglutaminase domain-containing protein [Candidatus Hydrogenedentota bacterium]